ncbi:Uncharacterised protein [Mycobacteroides abscessus subsp. abscessus]|nr:Uncharacterised protein [Mycobacteroides abscessus subsp. abscessus]
MLFSCLPVVPEPSCSWSSTWDSCRAVEENSRMFWSLRAEASKSELRRVTILVS